MKESEIRELFMIIRNFYSYFSYDDFTVQLWLDALRKVPFEIAERNLKRHVQHGKFPPTVAELSVGIHQNPEGRYIPGVDETRVMLDEMEREYQRFLQQPKIDTRKARLSVIDGHAGTRISRTR